MKSIEQSIEILDPRNGDYLLRLITEIGYVSHNTKKPVSKESAEKFIKQHCIEARPQHTTLLEFADVTVKVITDRAIANEIVRHRMATYNQRSSRYVLEDELEVIEPIGLSKKAHIHWYIACLYAEYNYREMRKAGATAEQCRDVLPLCTATEIVMKLNFNSWRNFFRLRTEEHAHPKMRALAKMILAEFKKRYPIVFDDFED